MTYRIEIYQEATVNDIAILNITDGELNKLNKLRDEGNVGKVKDFLYHLTATADEWVNGDVIDTQMPHYYTVDDAGFEVG